MSVSTDVAIRPWQRAALWLLFLGPFFFTSYGFANWLAGQNEGLTSIVYAWERHIPFIAWTILPYWVIDVLYGISLFVCTDKQELDTHAKRLLTAQLIAVGCFIVFPLEFSFERPATDGLAGVLFATLAGFDKPFNQAPSLHITLLVILWVLYARHLPRVLLWPFHILAFMIGVSVLTTYQHHFIDIPTGLLLGWFVIWLWPDSGGCALALQQNKQELQEKQEQQNQQTQRRRRIAGYYLAGAVVLTLIAFAIGGTLLWLLWPAVSLLFVAGNYALFGAQGFQKDSQGNMSMAAQWLLFPYLLGAWINSRVWTRSTHAADPIMDDVWLGRYPSQRDLQRNAYTTVIDLTAELPARARNINWYTIPCLDLIPLSEQDLVRIGEAIEQNVSHGPVLVCCALGYSRSAAAVIHWLLYTGRAADKAAAIELVSRARPGVVIKEDQRNLLAAAAKNIVHTLNHAERSQEEGEPG